VASLLQIKKEHAMTRDDTIKLAMKAGLLDKVDCSDDYFIPGDVFVEEIEAFAELVAREEREKWPNLDPVINWLENGCDPKEAAKELRLYAAAIRARGESK
jgi:hypothetical protein